MRLSDEKVNELRQAIKKSLPETESLTTISIRKELLEKDIEVISSVNMLVDMIIYELLTQ